MAEASALSFEASLKRIRVMANGKTIADTLCAGLLLEDGRFPVYYFPREDVRMDLLERSDHRESDPGKGDALFWNLKVGGAVIKNAAWSYEEPPEAAAALRRAIAFESEQMDHWFEEDEEVFGHPRDPHHRIDVRPSSREVRAVFNGETVARTRRALFLFETGLPTRYYIPPEDVRQDLLVPSTRTTICPYKGEASYWSLKVGDRTAEDAVWAYLHPLPEQPRIKNCYCFHPDRIDRLEVEGETAGGG